MRFGKPRDAVTFSDNSLFRPIARVIISLVLDRCKWPYADQAIGRAGNDPFAVVENCNRKSFVFMAGEQSGRGILTEDAFTVGTKVRAPIAQSPRPTPL